MDDLSCRPSTPVKTLWFEFLLAPSLLEKHLSLSSTDPSPTELIIQLLTNVLPSIHNEQNAGMPAVSSSLGTPPALIPTSGGPLQVPEVDGIPPPVPPDNEVETKKSLALKLLALKVAAYIKWDLNLLEKDLPLPIQERLITELKKIVTPPGKPAVEESGKPTSLTPDELFADILYNRWILRSLVLSSYPVRGQKGLTVQIPGQVDPTFVPQDVMESIIRGLSEKSEQACASLEEVLNKKLPVRMPLINCLGVVSEESPKPNHTWENGIMLLIDDVECQISYDLGCYFFHKENYQKAGEMLAKAASFSKTSDHIYCQINEDKLKGYCGACTHLLKQQSASSMKSLQERAQSSAASGYKDIVEILGEDNLKREIPLALRDALEMDLLQKEQMNDTTIKVIALNAIRKITAGQVIHMNFHIALETNESKMMDVINEAVKSVMPSLTTPQKNLMKNAIRMLYHSSTSIASALTGSDTIKCVFNETEIEDLYSTSDEMNKSTLTTDKQNFTEDPSIKVGQLERELLSASTSESISSLIKQLQSLNSAKPLWTLSHKWELPRHLASLVRNTHSADVVYILLAKASELRAIKKYVQARELYRMAQEEIRVGTSRLSRLIGWELLHTDLLEMIEMPPYKLQYHKQQCQEIIQKAKACIKAYYQEREAPPDSFLVDLCAIVLLNLREWESLNDLERRHDGYMELSYLLAAVCRDICSNKGSRSPPRDLWEAVIPIFSNSTNQYKRSSSGVIKDTQRDLPHAIMPRASFLQFITKLTDTLVLTIIISCITKLYNILKDSANGEVCLEYSVLWPSVVNNSSMYNTQMVTDTLHETLQHALSVHPAHSSWLKTRGDFMYVQAHFAAAMKNYLSAAMVSSDYFSQPLPRALFDDTQFKHMIHCCTKLHCHTQAAVLGQCLEEPNYQAAFKSLGEKVCSDSCDTYYPCIWDVTLLEYLINLHARRGEVDRRQQAVQLIGQLELNSNNNEEIQHEAANIRKGKFFRAIAKQYL